MLIRHFHVLCNDVTDDMFLLLIHFFNSVFEDDSSCLRSSTITSAENRAIYMKHRNCIIVFCTSSTS